MQLQVMTFNIRGTRDSSADGVNAWDNRRNLNIATIQKIAPDIIGFQEAQQGNLDAYAKSLTDYSLFQGYTASRERGQHEHTPVYWKSSRFDALDNGAFYLSETPHIESIGWQTPLVRVVAWVKLRAVASGAEFFVLNTHFHHQAESHETRNNCARLIIEQMNSHAGELPVLVMGDFNAVPDSPAYHTFQDAGFTDAYAASGGSHAVNTFHGYQGSDYPFTGQHIDWILTKGFAIHGCQVITDAEPPLYPSDHYPVVADIELRPIT